MCVSGLEITWLSGIGAPYLRWMTTWITRFDPSAAGPDGLVRVAVKDAIDMAGVITGRVWGGA